MEALAAMGAIENSPHHLSVPESDIDMFQHMRVFVHRSLAICTGSDTGDSQWQLSHFSFQILKMSILLAKLKPMLQPLQDYNRNNFYTA